MDEYIDAAGFTHFPKNEKRSKKKALTFENIINYPGYFWNKLINYNITLKIVAIALAAAMILGGLCGYSISHNAYVKQIEARDAAEAEAAMIAAQQAEKEATEGQRITMQRALTENLARVLQGVEKYELSKNAKLAYLQIIANRANPEVQYDVMRGTNTMEQVLQVPGQFQGFTYGSGYYTKENYQIAEEFLNGDQNYLNDNIYFWARISKGEVLAMSTYDGSKTNQAVN